MEKDQFSQLIDLWRGIANSLETIAKTYQPKPSTKKPMDDRVKFGQRVAMRQEERDSLVKDYGEKIVNDEIEKMNTYCMAHGKTYANYYFAVRNWLTKNGAAKLDPKLEKDWANMENPGNFVLNNPGYLESYRRFNPKDAQSIEQALEIKKQFS